jgi:phosphoribosyl-ATP pyrophosphohydrolase
VDPSETSHLNYLVIKTYKIAEQTGSYTHKPTWKDYFSKEIKQHAVNKCIENTVEVCQAAN